MLLHQLRHSALTFKFHGCNFCRKCILAFLMRMRARQINCAFFLLLFALLLLLRAKFARLSITPFDSNRMIFSIYAPKNTHCHIRTPFQTRVALFAYGHVETLFCPSASNEMLKSGSKSATDFRLLLFRPRAKCQFRP
jgi:hypothetical protein